MRGPLVVSLFLSAGVLAGCLGPADPLPASGADPHNGDDLVVVAVLDWQLNPYHWDFLAEHMPQHQDDDPTNDLPLDRDPAEWLPGFPGPEAFASYDSLDLTLTPSDPDADPESLYEKDRSEWAKVRQSEEGAIHYRTIPGTKVVGLITTSDDGDGFAASSHGVGASSVSVGNRYGTCPSCLLVFVDIPGAAGEEWVRQQDWIDVTTHSYEASTFSGYTQGATRDNIRDCENGSRQAAAERGQQIFWAAGNGLLNTFTLPQTTLVNCQKGPEWTVTVGAIHPTTEGSYTGHGKPVHVASIGQDYPRAGGDSVTDDGTFSGTSNASPVTAGLYAEALYRLRAATAGDERLQRDGVILQGDWTCGTAEPDCALGDGVLTAHELRAALFRAATPTDAYFHSFLLLDEPIPLAGSDETELWTEGHGAFLGRLGDWDAQVAAIVAHTTGDAADPRTPELLDWMTAYSWCVQQVWGEWQHGYWKPGDAVPAPDPGWPNRSWMASDACPATVEAILGRV